MNATQAAWYISCSSNLASPSGINPSMSDAATRTATPVTTLVNAAIAEFVRSLARLFRVTLPATEETVLQWGLLGAVLCVGTFVRAWKFGARGLHGDEETMAMAAMHILKDGWPIL